MEQCTWLVTGRKGMMVLEGLTGRFQGPDPGKLHVVSAVSQTQAANRRRRGKKEKEKS